MSTHDRRLYLVGKNPLAGDTSVPKPTNIEIDMDAASLVTLIATIGLALRHPQFPGYVGSMAKKILDVLIDTAHHLDPAVWKPPIPPEVWEEWRRWRAAEKLPLKYPGSESMALDKSTIGELAYMAIEELQLEQLSHLKEKLLFGRGYVTWLEISHIFLAAYSRCAKEAILKEEV